MRRRTDLLGVAFAAVVASCASHAPEPILPPVPALPPARAAAPPEAEPKPAPPPPRPPPTSEADCRAMLGTPAAADDGATITPERGSGKSERFAGIVRALKRQRGALRCCYDLWSKDHPRDAGLTLAFAIDEKGAITSIKLKGDDNNAFAMEAGACIVDLALDIQYPASPSGMTTTFEYDLGFVYRPQPVQ